MTSIVTGAMACIERDLPVFPTLNPNPDKKLSYSYGSLPKVVLRSRKPELKAMLEVSAQYAVMLNVYAVLDADTPMMYDTIVARMQHLELSLFTVRTVRGGHVYIRCKALAKKAPGILPGLDIVTGYNAYVIGPGSQHGNGTYTIEHDGAIPSLSLEQLQEVLNAAADAIGQARPELPKTKARKRDTRIADNAIEHGVPVGERNNTYFMIFVDAIANGDAARLEQAKRQAAQDGLSSAEIAKTVGSANSSLKDAKKRPVGAYGAIHEKISGDRWMTKAQEQVWLYLSRLQLLHGANFHATIGNLSAELGISQKTIRLALKAFTESGLLEVSGKRGRANLYTITARPSQDTSRRATPSLNPSLAAVYDAIRAGAETYKQIALLARVSIDSARRAVLCLFNDGLAVIEYQGCKHIIRACENHKTGAIASKQLNRQKVYEALNQLALERALIGCLAAVVARMNLCHDNISPDSAAILQMFVNDYGPGLIHEQGIETGVHMPDRQQQFAIASNY